MIPTSVLVLREYSSPADVSSLLSGFFSPVSVCVCVCVISRFSHVRPCKPMDCSLPGSSVNGILQARILEWVTITFLRGSSQPRDRTQVSVSSALQVKSQGKPLPMSHIFLNLVFSHWFFIRRVYIQAPVKHISIPCSSMAFLDVFPVGFQSQVFGASSFLYRIRGLGHLMWSLDPWLLRESKCSFTLYY